MNLELFIARRIHFSRQKGEKKVSTPAIKIAIAGVAIGIAAMILSVAIVTGFKQEIRNKIVGFGSHIQITNYDNNTSYETFPICANDSLVNAVKSIKGVKQVEKFIVKPGVIKTPENFQGVLFKGVTDDFDWKFFSDNLIEGSLISADSTGGNQIVISKVTASKLNLKVGDDFLAYFFPEDKILVRKFVITGIFNTNFEDYDKLYAITNQKVLQKLYKWNDEQVSGLEVLVDDFDHLNDIRGDVFLEMITHTDSDGNTLFARSITEMNPATFNWLDLLDTNVVVIISLMFAVSAFTMISGLLIIILERTNMIGILKALGHANKKIRKTFLYISSFLILKGMFWGNVIALAIIVLQKCFGIIRLDPDTYYVSEMPVNFNLLHILLINAGSLLLSMLVMIIPSYLIAKIAPAKSIRFE